MAVNSTPIVLLDGGLGTTLEEPPFAQSYNEDTPLWSSHLLITSPQTLCAAQTAFVAAGCDVLLSATYQTSFAAFERTILTQRHAKDSQGCSKTQLEAETKNIMQSALRIAQDALVSQCKPLRHWRAGFHTPSIALSLGPYGATLNPSQEYSGDYPAELCSIEALQGWHARRLAVFAEHPASWESIEFVAFETFKRLDEVQAIRHLMTAIRDQNHGSIRSPKKWWISSVWPDEATDADISAMVEAMLQNVIKPCKTVLAESSEYSDNRNAPATPWAIGVNCTSIDKVARIIHQMESSVSRLYENRKWRNEWQQDSAPGSILMDISHASEQRPWLVLYPDGAKGLRYDSSKMAWTKLNKVPDDGLQWHEAMWRIVDEVRSRGNWAGILVGGCCKTGPAHIRNLRACIDRN